MPVILYENNTGYTWAIWEVTESEEMLLSLIALTDDEKAEYYNIKHPKKRLEFLSGRLILKEVVEKRNQVFHGIYKDSCGKPHLLNSGDSISLSHSYPLAGAILHQNNAAGIDIEKPQSKLNKIAHKFLSKEEMIASGEDQTLLCIYWCAKETLYKIYGRKQVLFSVHLSILPFDIDKAGIIQGRINLPDFQMTYQLRYFQFKEHIICFNI